MCAMSDDLWALAPDGQVYVCGACGKTSRNQAGFERRDNPRGGPSVAAHGWDESCMLNAILCFKKAATETEWKAVPSGWSLLAADEAR
jgi:hypothetical protein